MKRTEFAAGVIRHFKPGKRSVYDPQHTFFTKCPVVSYSSVALLSFLVFRLLHSLEEAPICSTERYSLKGENRSVSGMLVAFGDSGHGQPILLKSGLGFLTTVGRLWVIAGTGSTQHQRYRVETVSVCQA